MKLEKFKKYGKRNKKIICSVIGIVLIICGVLLFKSFAFFESQYNFDVIKGRIPEFNRGDIQLALTLNGDKISNVPNKNLEGNQKYDSIDITCDGGIGTWDYDKWGIYVTEMNKEKVKCTIAFKTMYEEKLLNGSIPILKEDLIPITIGNGGVVTYADIKNEWYNYEKKNWANAVILTEEGKSKNYTAGSTIEENDIESYFVWIPKYAYKIQTLGTSSRGQEKPFEIRFGITNTVDNTTECIAPNVNGQDGKCVVGKYMTHPAFTSFGEIKGLWVGKFESNGSIDALTIKPNLYSLNTINVSTMFKTAYNYKRSSDTQKNLDSHMMKNTEWGAMVYLTYSIYGRCNNVNCEEINVNNKGITGSSAAEIHANKEGEYYEYSNANSVRANTTGNYSGIYDISGGTWEYMAAAWQTLTIGQSGFTAEEVKYIEKKYYDIYNSSVRILGDATSETKCWFGNNCNYITSTWCWYWRGGYVMVVGTTGIFSFSYSLGEPWSGSTFRLVLAPL